MPNVVTVVGTPDDAEDADYYVCQRTEGESYFKDDLYDFCCKCGEKVRYRPHGPSIPKKICIVCALPEMENSTTEGDLEVTLTQKTADEVAAYLKRQ
jgi:hypothetical protein